MTDLKELKLIKKIGELQKKVTELYKYKNFVELEKNSKNFYEKFEKINKNNLLLVNHIKIQKNTIELLIREKDEYKKKLTQLKDDGLTFVNKKKFYELNLKINDLEKSNEELKNIIKNKEEIFLKLNIEITELKNNNNNYHILMKKFINDYQNIDNCEIIEEIKEQEKTKSKKSEKKKEDTKGYESDNENLDTELEQKYDIEDYELDDNILL